ncbi:RNFT2 (predicted) [Pycnogonum litorale]
MADSSVEEGERNESVPWSLRTSINNATSETPRRLREDFHHIIRELQPLVNRAEQATPEELATWLNMSNNPNHGDRSGLRSSSGNANNNPQSTDDEVIINMMDSIDHSSNSTVNDDIRYQAQPHGGDTQNTQSSTAGESQQQNIRGQAESLRNSPELRAILSVLEKYIGFAIIMLFKIVFDHKIGILVIIGLGITFFHANSSIKRQIAKQQKRLIGSLFAVTLNLTVCMFFIYYIFDDEQFQYAIILVPVCNRKLELVELLWIVVVTDFILKFITILVKILVLILPAKFIPYQKKGKFYLFLEQTSQLYRLLAPVQPWLCYLTEPYEGHEKIFSVLLSTGYIIAKASPLVKSMKNLKTAFIKLLQPVIYGSRPSVEQLKESGDNCPICQDLFRNPTILNCKHIFCEECVAAWFDREKTCPMCRAEIADDPTWRDGSTSLMPQLF